MLAWIIEAAAILAVIALVVHRVTALRVVVRDEGGFRELWLARRGMATLQARVALDDPLRSGLAYTDGFLLWAPTAGEALYIGAGAGIGPRQLVALRPDVTVHVVDRDARVLAVAAERFGLAASPRLHLERGDGRAALERPGAYARIVFDAFGAGDFPARLATIQAFAAARARLAPGGSLVVNLAGTFHGAVLPAVHAGLCEAFGAEHVVTFGVPHEGRYAPDERGNTIAVAFRDGVPATAPDADLPDDARAHLPALPGILELRAVSAPPAAAALDDARVGRGLSIV
jgi:hypothetical protein